MSDLGRQLSVAGQTKEFLKTCARIDAGIGLILAALEKKDHQEVDRLVTFLRVLDAQAESQLRELHELNPNITFNVNQEAGP